MLLLAIVIFVADEIRAEKCSLFPHILSCMNNFIVTHCACRYKQQDAEPQGSPGTCVDAVLSSWSSVRQPSFCHHLSRHHRCHVYMVSSLLLTYANLLCSYVIKNVYQKNAYDAFNAGIMYGSVA